MATLKYKNKDGDYVPLSTYTVNSPLVVQDTGDSTTAVMSLNAVTLVVLNLPNDEDLMIEKDKLKFADRSYSPENYSGKGYKILRRNILNRKNILLLEEINYPNTIYEIRYDFDLDNIEISIPEGCILYFNGGSFNNGSILFNDTLLDGNPIINSNILKNSSLRNNIINIDWFGAQPNNPDFDNAIIFTKLTNFYYKEKGGTILVPKGIYYSTSFVIPHAFNLIGSDIESSVLKSIDNGKSYTYFQNDKTYTIDNVFVAVLSPKTNIKDITIDGGAKEGFKVTGIGLFLAAFHTNFYNIAIYNCYYGCLINATVGGISKYDYCRFDSVGIDFCLKFMWEQAAISIQHCYIEDGSFTYEEKQERNKNSSIILFEDCIVTEGINISHNYYESNYCKYVYNFVNCFLNGVFILNNTYLFGLNYGQCEYIYRLDNDTSVPITIINENYQNLNGLKYYFLINNKVTQTNFICFNINNYSNSVIYYDENNIEGNKSVTVNKTNAHVIFYNKNGIITDITPTNSIQLPDNTSIASIKFYMDNIYRVIESINSTRLKITSDTEIILNTPLLSLLSDNIYINKNIINSSGEFFFGKGLSGNNLLMFKSDNKNGEFPTNVNDGYIHIKEGKPYMCISNGIIGSERIERWVDISHLNNTISGKFSDRPTDNLSLGTCYFCTDKQTLEGLSDGIMIYHKGNNVWVDALGRTVE